MAAGAAAMGMAAGMAAQAMAAGMAVGWAAAGDAGMVPACIMAIKLFERQFLPVLRRLNHLKGNSCLYYGS